MAEWRVLRGWSDAELIDRLAELQTLERNFRESDEEMTSANGWMRQHSWSVVAHERPGVPEPEGPFERLSVALENYEFSEPRIVTGHFDPAEALGGRRMLLELKVFGLRYLCGTIVAQVRNESTDHAAAHGFRYETLEGHIESGWEWFLVQKDRASGDVRFSIEARWKKGEFPNFWSRFGFDLVGPAMQKRWHRLAHRRMMALATQPMDALERSTRELLAHEGPKVTFDFD